MRRPQEITHQPTNTINYDNIKSRRKLGFQATYEIKKCIKPPQWYRELYQTGRTSIPKPSYTSY